MRVLQWTYFHKTCNQLHNENGEKLLWAIVHFQFQSFHSTLLYYFTLFYYTILKNYLIKRGAWLLWVEMAFKTLAKKVLLISKLFAEIKTKNSEVL